MPIKQIKGDQMWVLRTSEMAYCLGVDPDKRLQHCYWGEPLPYADDYPHPESHENSWSGSLQEEAVPWGGIRYREPAFKITYADHTRALELEYQNTKTTSLPDGEELTITLNDTDYNLNIDLTYKLIEEHDLISRSATISNNGDAPVTLNQVLSGQWHIPHLEKYRLTHLCGTWGNETNVTRTELTQGKKTIESRRGTTSHQHNPWFAIDNGEATETTGNVYYGALAYSGNWKLVFEQNSHEDLQISGGINDFDFEWHLPPGDSFTTPSFIGGYSSGGFGSASRKMHDYQRRSVLPDSSPEDIRPLLYNSWYATEFDINEEQQKQLADRASDLGVELFVIDDGWFGDRNDDTAGLGDWYVNEEKFPSGLDDFIKYVNKNGMGFGLWVEPEMVNPDSDLYREHPDWVYHFPNRERSEQRNQLVLNLSREDVQDYVRSSMNRLLSEYDIDFVKWDMNRHFSEPGWPEAPPERQREIWVRHTRAVYDIFDHLRENHPDVIFESCSGGGGRVDLGILQRAHQAWTSDNVDPYDRLFIQEGFSYAYIPKAMENWVVDYPVGITGRDIDLEYAFHVAMTGSLGIGADLTKWSESELETARGLIAEYKDVRSIIQNGDQYRLKSPRNNAISAIEYMGENADEAVIFLFLHSKKHGDVFPTIPIQGLVEEGQYRIGKRNKVLSGKALQEKGLTVDIRGDFQSELIKIERVDNE